MMTVSAKKYLNSALATRLWIGVTTAVFVNAMYCLVYRYAAGNPATVFEAFSWGVINIAPWVAIFEIGRSSKNMPFLVRLFVAAIVSSLILEAVLTLSWPTAFDLTRRIPAVLLTAVALLIYAKFEERLGNEAIASCEVQEADLGCDWVVTAGNYVEVHRLGKPARLVRSSLAQFIKNSAPGLVQVHRRYAVRESSVARFESKYVVLVNGTRLPIGNRYRAELNDGALFVPSSQKG